MDIFNLQRIKDLEEECETLRQRVRDLELDLAMEKIRSDSAEAYISNIGAVNLVNKKGE